MMAERYLLGELNEGERDAFEEHLFECSECFEQVKSGTEFINSLKEIGIEEAAAVPSGWRPAIGQWFRPKSAQILGLLFVGVASLSVYQGLLLRQANLPEIVSVQTLHPDARDGSGSAILASKQGAFELRLVFQPDTISSVGRIQIMDEAGKEITAVPVHDLHRGELQVRFSAGKFHDGKYLLVLKAMDPATGSEKLLNQYPFELKLQD